MTSVEITHRPIDRWPQEPTRFPRRSPFRSTWPQTLELLARELGKLGATRAFLQLDVTERDIRVDGAVRANARPATQRVIVSAKTAHGDLSLPCDTFDDWHDNVRAIALSLEALRSVDRYGVTKRGEQYRGLRQLTAGTGPVNVDEAAAFLAKYSTGESHRRNAADIAASSNCAEQVYREAAKRLHPDANPNADGTVWNHLQVAIAILREHHGGAQGRRT